MKRMTMLLLIFTAATKKTYAFTPDDAQIEYATGTILLFIVLIGICIYLMMRNSALKQELKRAEEQLQSFTDVVQNMRTPVELIRKPLEETLTNDTLTNEGVGNLNTAIRNANTIIRFINQITHTEVLPPTESSSLTLLTAEEVVVPTVTASRMLIFEPDAQAADFLVQHLSDQYELEVVHNGLDAIDKVRELKPDLIIASMNLPGMGGDELCSKVKNNIETSHIPIVLLIELEDRKGLMKGLKTSADEYVIKPFNIDILKATLTNLLTNKALMRKRYADLDFNTSAECVNCSTDIDWKFIDGIKRHVEEHMANPSFNVDMLCTLLNMSRTSFYNKLKALTDQAPADYVRIIRLKRAAQLLKDQQHSITEVAELTGFSDAKYFREVFKKHFKVSPSKYGKGED